MAEQSLSSWNRFSKVADLVSERVEYWHPRVRDPEHTRVHLAEFYDTRADYHQMTAGGDKLSHPQVRLLLEMIQPNDLCVEFGCGGGVVLSAVARKARSSIGMDISLMSLRDASERSRGTHRLVAQADAAVPPLKSGISDVAYSFEVLEHTWDPEAVITEMVRVLRPGGLLFFTTPNGYSLDLHLRRRAALRWLDLVGAGSRWLRSAAEPHCYRNMEPDLSARPAYPDCDMITKIFPRSLERHVQRLGCRIERLETFFFQKDKAPDNAALTRFERLERHPFYRYFGDHILLVARKGE